MSIMAYTMEEIKKFSIKEKIDFLKKYDKNYCIFGAAKHKYILNEPLSEEQVVWFEEKYHVTLPDEYRDFVKTIGDGGAGPGYGLCALLGEENSPCCFIGEPFLLEQDFDVDDYWDRIDCNSSDCEKCKNKEECLMYETELGEYKYQSGSLTICYHGCTYYSRIIMNGNMSGEIWEESIGEGFKRFEVNFIKWYERWLDDVIALILPFVNAVKDKLPFEQIMQIKGGHMLHFNDVKAKFVAGMIGANVELPTNHSESKAKYIENVKRAYK